MKPIEVRQLFEQSKRGYLLDLFPSKNPVAFLLGGQGASGKGGLTGRIQENNDFEEGFFSINGDLYRKQHPRHEELSKNPETYSAKTQIFSNVFTEGFIEEAIKRKLNVSVEGTMRNPDTPLSTAAMFRENGYRVEAYVIAAPPEFSSLNLYTRYANELQRGEKGRLANKKSHDTAAEMMPKTLDILYKKKAVDAIHIYSCFAENKVESYHLENGVWDKKTLPSEIIRTAREEQRQNLDIIKKLLERSKIIESVTANKNILSEVEKARTKLKMLLDRKEITAKAVSAVVSRLSTPNAKWFTKEQFLCLEEYKELTTPDNYKSHFSTLMEEVKKQVMTNNTMMAGMKNVQKELIDYAEGKIRLLSNGMRR